MWMRYVNDGPLEGPSDHGYDIIFRLAVIDWDIKGEILVGKVEINIVDIKHCH